MVKRQTRKLLKRKQKSHKRANYRGGAPVVCVQHKERITANLDYAEIEENIIGDNLMGKVKVRDLVMTVFHNAFVTKLIVDWYAMSAVIRDGLDHGEAFHVYRGIKLSYIPEHIIVQPIPFSTAYETDAGIGFTDNGKYLLDITVEPNVAFTCINNPGEGDEIVLPAGVCVITGVVQNVPIVDLIPGYVDRDPSLKYDFETVTIIRCGFVAANTVEKMGDLHRFYGIRSYWNPIPLPHVWLP